MANETNTSVTLKPRANAPLGSLAVDRDNNLNLLRLFCAGSVLVGHVYTIDYLDLTLLTPPLVALNAIMNMGLETFFILSGFLITASMLRTEAPLRFAALRAARILPALPPAALFCVLVAGPLSTDETLRAYFSSPLLMSYLAKASFAIPDGTLPGVYVDHALQGVVNEPIWTLRYEMLMYAATLLAFLAGLLNARAFIVGAIAFLGFYALNETSLHLDETIAPVKHVLRFGLCFMVGAGFWLFRDRVRLKGAVALGLVAAAVLAAWTPLADVARTLALAYGALYLAYVPRPLFGHHRAGDYSYGVYIYHWPVASTAYALDPDISAFALLLVTLCLTAALAAASWRWVEAPALAFAHDRVRWAGRMRA